MEAAITFRAVITPLCNSPSGMYILIGFSVKTSAGRQIFHQLNTVVSIWLQKYARIFVLGHYKFREARNFARASLPENCLLLRTDNVRDQICEHIFSPNGDLMM